MLIREGWRELRLKKALDKYQQGLVSVDKAANIAGLAINEMMKEIASHGIKSEETLEEYDLLPLSAALNAVHFPQDKHDLENGFNAI